MAQWQDCNPRLSARSIRTGRITRLACIAVVASSVTMVLGCTEKPVQTPDERLRQQAAVGAEQMHHELKDAGKEARQALKEAGRTTRDVVAGARQGWREGGDKAGSADVAERDKVDINHASLAELESLPGIHGEVARRIVAGRPYGDSGQLRKRGIVTHEEYARIAERLSAE